jgi:hypothetical protein
MEDERREEGAVESNREIIEGLKSRQGYTEEEAEVAYHLVQAENLLVDMVQKTFESGSGAYPRNAAGVFRMSQIEPHFRALFALLDRRVLKRHHPESWWRPGDPSGGSQPD